MSNLLRIGMLFAAVALVGCSGGDKEKDGGGKTDVKVDGGPGLPDGFIGYPCEDEGQSCNAHDPCAIDPICKRDATGALVCIPSSMQQCDDGLDCTDDVCKGMGLCENVPKAGYCALPVLVGGSDAGPGTTEIRCFQTKQPDPNDTCQICDPETDPTKWSPANGGACDDNNACTKEDYCQDGVCKGVNYASQCADNFGCTDDLCDGKGGCLGNQLRSDWCLINGACYKDQESHPNGSCNICDVSTSQSAWTPISNTCMIDSKCFNAQAKHPTGDCAICDPAKSTSAWTTTSNGCLINNTCYKTGDKDSIQCSECDPTKSVTAWTPLSGLCKIDGQCYKQGDKHTGGCAECDTAASTTSWTVVGSYCLISSVCKNPQDKDSTGCNECDPTKDKYNWSTVANTCFISGKCFQQGDKNTAATCAECDTAVSTTSWTVKTNECFIGGTCYTSGTANTGACATCAPATDKYNWTPSTGKCLIVDKCYSDGDKDGTGCLQCSSSADPTGWSPVSGASVTNYDFESGGSTGWSIVNTDASVGWVVSTKRPASGSYSLYYGDPTTGNFSGSGANSGTATMPAVTLAAGKKAGMTFMLYMDTEGSTYYDVLKVYVGSTQVWEKDVTTTVTMKTWMPISIDLSAYAGQSVTIKFEFDTVDSVANTTEGVHIDDITIYHNC